MLGVRHAVAVSSGTDALLLALMALDIKAGDEVVTPTYSFFATAGAIARLGAKPVLVDIDETTFNLDPEQRGRRHHAADEGHHPRAPVRPERRHGSDSRRRRARRTSRSSKTRRRRSARRTSRGCSADWARSAASRSSRARTSARSATRACSRRTTTGWRSRRGCCARTAWSRATTITSSARTSGWTRCRRRSCASRRRTSPSGPSAAARTRLAIGRCSGTPALLDRVTLPNEPPDRWHIYNQFVIRTADRDGLKAHLDERGIGTEIYYPVPFHLQPCFADLGHRRGDFPQRRARRGREPGAADLQRAHRRPAGSRRRRHRRVRPPQSRRVITGRSRLRRARRRLASRLSPAVPLAHDADPHRARRWARSSAPSGRTPASRSSRSPTRSCG